jgi:hypothetical protein
MPLFGVCVDVLKKVGSESSMSRTICEPTMRAISCRHHVFFNAGLHWAVNSLCVMTRDGKSVKSVQSKNRQWIQPTNASFHYTRSYVPQSQGFGKYVVCVNPETAIFFPVPEVYFSYAFTLIGKITSGVGKHGRFGINTVESWLVRGQIYAMCALLPMIWPIRHSWMLSNRVSNGCWY